MAEVKRRRKTAVAGIAPNEPERDILDQYLYEVSTYPLLKGTEEIEVARRIRAGDPDALQELVQRNLRFVISVAKKYQNRGLPLIDLIGEGNVGLLTAARKFDPDQGVKFISYAVWWIRQAILSALARQGRTVRVPLNRTADLSRIIKASEILRQKLRREPTPEELSQLTGAKKEIAFGSQIRTYTFHPEQRIKDHRTGMEIGNVEAVMDGQIDEFIKAYLLWARSQQA